MRQMGGVQERNPVARRDKPGGCGSSLRYGVVSRPSTHADRSGLNDRVVKPTVGEECKADLPLAANVNHMQSCEGTSAV